MQPIYFPHTYIPNETVQALTACFQKITVYQPTLRHLPESMIQWQTADRLEIRTPVREFESDIESSLKSYQYIGEIHRGRKGEIKNYQLTGIPCFDDTSPQKIRADLIREMQADLPRDNRFTPAARQLIQAGLFLQMAQAFDSHQDEIQRNLAACTRMEKSLFKNLKEDDDSLFQELVTPPLRSDDSPGGHMLPERLAAWTRLFFYDILTSSKETPFPAIPIFFITTNRFLFNEMTNGTDNTLSFSLDPIFKQPDPVATLMEMARATDPALFREFAGSPVTTETLLAIEAAVVINEPPLAFLAKHAGLIPRDVPPFPIPEHQPNTLIGLLSTWPKRL
jgi:hypothetical protein